MKTKPNIVFFFTDDQRFDTINSLGNKEIITPNMDSLVRDGSAFLNAHIPSGTSPAVCMPSRAMLHTGRNVFGLENEGQGIPDSHIMLGETLKNAGYHTFGTGKWHNGISSYNRSFSDGGSIFFGGMWDHWNVPVCDYDLEGKYDNLIPFTMDFYYNNSPYYINCDKFSMGKHSSELISDTAIDFIKSERDKQPFFMYLSYLAPHDPRDMPKKFRDMYNPDTITLPPNYMDNHPFDYGINDIRDELLAPYPRTPDTIRKHIAEYYGMISHLDFEIGRVILALKESGELENTILILAGDNGLSVGQHGLMGKQNHYEHSLRVPLIFSGPGIPKNKTMNEYVYLFDIYPTLCDLIGLDIPQSVQGRSFEKLFRNADYITRKTLYFAYTDIIRSVKDERYKLVEFRQDIGITQLFDLINDPYEMKNLHGNEKYSGIIAELREKLGEYRDEWKELEHSMGKRYWKF